MQITMAGTCFFYDFDKQHCFDLGKNLDLNIKNLGNDKEERKDRRTGMQEFIQF